MSTLRECPIEPGVLWAGTDDGRVHVSRDGGGEWTDVTPPDLPEWSFVRIVEPSPHRAGTVYLAATRYKLDDYAPYLYRTTDYGATWTSIVGDMPDDGFVRVIRADPNRENVLYVGTETGIHLSVDDGATWRRWESNLPVTPVYDLEVEGTDLVVATHGRSFWICDDLTLLYQALDDPAEGTRLFQPRDAWRVLPDIFAQYITTEGKDYMVSLGKAATFAADMDETGQTRRTFLDAGEAGPLGVTITYVLPDEEGLTVELEFTDGDGNQVRRFGPKPEGWDEMDDDEKAFRAGPWITTRPGVNRFVWDLRHEGATRVLGNKLSASAYRGPLVLPGTYQARLVVTSPSGGEHVETRKFTVANDPRVDVTGDDLAAQLEALIRVRDHVSRAHEAAATIRSLKKQLAIWRERTDLGDEPLAAVTALEEGLHAIEDTLMKPGEHKDTFGLNEPARLSERLASVLAVIGSADSRPTRSSLEVADKYAAAIDDQLERLDEVIRGDLAAFNRLIAESGLPAVQAG